MGEGTGVGTTVEVGTAVGVWVGSGDGAVVGSGTYLGVPVGAAVGMGVAAGWEAGGVCVAEHAKANRTTRETNIAVRNGDPLQREIGLTATATNPGSCDG